MIVVKHPKINRYPKGKPKDTKILKINMSYHLYGNGKSM